MLTDSPRAGRLLEVSHVAHRWSVSQEFVRRLIRSGQLPAVLVGTRYRLTEADVQDYLDRPRRHRWPEDKHTPLRAVPLSQGA